ncbi:MAG: triose-phosphate isomerase [Candidatus Pacebacteria bacterium]|nr:triose-phosphate isomerase [Candidatus Paceibacterota bacterium]
MKKRSKKVLKKKIKPRSKKSVNKIATKPKKIIIANWKENPGSLMEAKSLAVGVRSFARELKKTVLVICPPHPFLTSVAAYFSRTKDSKHIFVGAQDLSAKKGGSFTGEVAASMLKSLGAGYVIVGHSERRAMGETDAIVNQKVLIALENGLKPVVCVGESARDDQGDYLSHIKNQIKAALQNVIGKDIANIVIAYEPLWAIGNQAFQVVTPHDMHQMSIFIKKYLMELVGGAPASMVAVIYGGSVTAENVSSIINEGQADGVLVGRESLSVENFRHLLKNSD